jgi:hypothetical protein
MFSRWVFWIAGIYGLLVMLPQYFLEERIGRDAPPPITHLEYFYGFVGVVVAWQVVFLIIGCDPQRYRLLMLPSILEKLSFGVAVMVLWSQGKVVLPVPIFASIDLVLGVLFAAAFWTTGGKRKP